MSGRVMIRTIGGPHPGDRIGALEVYGWPLPDRLDDEGGYYRKISQSALDKDVSEHVLRGAQYEWVPQAGESQGSGPE